MIVALRFYGSSAAPLALPEARRILTIGSGDADLVIPAELARDVAAVHATIERTASAIIVRDHGGGHGLYRSPRSPRVAELHLHAGAVGYVGGCAVLALDQALVTLRPRLAWSIGLDADAAVDDALVAVASDQPLALVGPRGLDALPLARAIHDTAGPGRPFCLYDGTAPADAGTVVIDLDTMRRLRAAHVAEMLAPRCAARVIVLASRASVLRGQLDHYADRVRPIDLVPLAKRRPEIIRLLTLVWAEELGCDRRVAELDVRTRRGLVAHRWGGNFVELRTAAVRLLAYAEHRTLRAAARALGITHQSLSQNLHHIGAHVADQGDRDPVWTTRSGRTSP